MSHELQRLYAHAHDRRDAAHRLHRILVRCADSSALDLHRLARTLEAWRTELLAYWTPTGRRGGSNGPTEATNCLMKKAKRVGHGCRNLHNYRLRLLLTSVSTGAPSPEEAAPATPIRGRQSGTYRATARPGRRRTPSGSSSDGCSTAAAQTEVSRCR